MSKVLLYTGGALHPSSGEGVNLDEEVLDRS